MRRHRKGTNESGKRVQRFSRYATKLSLSDEVGESEKEDTTQRRS